jgi:subtilase family serine protease
MSSFKLGFNQKRMGASNAVSSASINLGSNSKIGAPSRIYNFCKATSPAPSLCINQLVNIKQNNDLIVKPLYNLVPLNFSQEQKYYNPLQIRKAYNVPTVNAVNSIRNAIITIIIAYHHPNLITNLNYVSNKYGLPKPNITIYNLGSNTNTNTNWDYEANLDVQMCYTINPYSVIRVVESKSAAMNDILSAISYANNKNNFANKTCTDIMSMSFGTQDVGGFSNLKTYFNNSNICYLAASGDNGYPSYPSTTPNVLSVGATNLQLNSNNTKNNETLWNSSGCGYAATFAKPAYQIGNNTNNRSVPDICEIGATESAVIVWINENPYAMGGTSVSAPIASGLLSLLVQSRLNIKNSHSLTTIQNTSASSVKQIQKLLYNNANYAQFFYDITSGNSGNIQSGYFTSTIGFDIASGLGVMNINNIINTLKNV